MTDVAIVGMGCRFPGGAHSPEEYWSLLTERVDGMIEVPADRWDVDRFYDADPDAPGRMYVRKGGFLRQSVWDFDPEPFGISPREASHMDPQQRLMLEVTWEALDDAGAAGRVAGRDVGVYVGAFMADSQLLRHMPAARTSINSHTPTSATFTMLSNRLSYVLDLRGPSMTIDTACSSSMVAIHEAVQSLTRGECELALAGGVNVMLHPETTISMCKGRLLAPDGRCKSFDAAADGYARGEGAGVLVLKPLAAALRDRDRVYCVIRGTGTNQDGRTSGITVPNAGAQAELARRVCAAAGLDPAQIGFVEAHGTGTAVGDPLEMSALAEAFGRVAGRSQPLVVGSVKSGIGHLEAAAGVAGVMKAALTVHHRTIAPQAWLGELNPDIPFAEYNLRVPTAIEPFPGEPVVAANGFGYGGSNAHVVMGAAPAAEPAPRTRPIQVFPVSGASEAAARAAADELRPLVTAGRELDALTAALWSRRSHLPFRTAVPYRDAAELAVRLEELAGGAGEAPARATVPAGTRPVFVFSGMGPQWWRMGRDLLDEDGIFARKAREIDAEFVALAGWSIIEELRRGPDESRVTRTEVAQPANFLVQACLYAELEALGILPAAVVGHSVGEVTAAYVSGTLTLHDALLVSLHRARLQATTAGTGGMLAAGLPVAEVEAWIPAGAAVSIAAVNGSSSVTLAGDQAALETIRERLSEAGLFARALRVEVPYHSALMDPILPELMTVLDGVAPAAPDLPLYSTVTAGPVSDASWGASYWCDNVREPVRFADTIDALIAAGHRLFLEVGPHPVLSGNVRELLLRAGESGTCIPTLAREQDARMCLRQAVADLYAAGCAPATAPSAHVDLPAYPWQRTTMWAESEAVRSLRHATADTHPLLGERTGANAPEWEVELSAAQLPWLPDHVVDGRVLLPGAGYLDAALSAAAELMPRDVLALESVRFVAPLVIADHDVPVLRLAVDERTGRFTLRSRSATATEWTVNATGRLVDGDFEPAPVALASDGEAIAGADLYERLAGWGLQYGPAFRGIAEARVSADTVVATIDVSPAGAHHLANPTVTDAALQCVAALLTVDEAGAGAHVPVALAGIRRYAAFPAVVTVVAHRHAGPGLRADATVCGPDGEVLLELEGIEFAPISPPLPALADLDQLFYETEWEWRDAREVAAVPELAVIVDIGAPERARELAAAHPNARLVQPSRVAEPVRDGLDDPAIEHVLVAVVAGESAGDDEPAGLDAIAGLVDVARGVKVVLDALDRRRADSIRAVIVTEHAFQLPGDRHEPNLAHAALAGARRALLNEQPLPRWSLVDTEPTSSLDDVWAELAGAGGDDADEVCLREDVRMVPRLRKTLAGRLERFAAAVPVTGADASFELEPARTGRFEDLALRACERVAPGPGEVELRIEAVGLSAADARKAADGDPAVGLEALAVVARVGEGVTHLSPGDRAWVLAPGVFRRYATLAADAGFIALVPRDAALEHGVSLLPYITARYALDGVEAGETVLIQSAGDGTGLAAVRTAKALGARVIAGATGSEQAVLALATGADEVVSARSLNFVDEVLRLTGGHGADVVLTAAAGEIARQSVRVTAEFGRVVVLGDAAVLEPFERNLSFTRVDVERLRERRPRVFRRLAAEVLERLESGEYRPLPIGRHPLPALAEAFSAAARPERAARVLVELDGAAQARPRRPEFAVRPNASYLITGGFGAFGLATARWLASEGARHLVLVGRRGASSPSAKAQVQALAAAGVEVTEGVADIADLGEVQRLVTETIAGLPPLRGVFHAAGVLDDRPLEDITSEQLRRVLAPKTRGALNLHAALSGVELDAFVLYSSVSALVGPVPQIAYAGANAVLDALAAARRAQGLPAVSINWGALGGGGMAEASAEVERYLALLGVRPIAMDRATALMQECLGLGDDVVAAVVADLDWARYEAACPASAASCRFSEHVAAASAGGSGAAALRRELARLPAEQRREVLAYVLAEQLSEVLGIDAGGIDLATPLTDLGVDSLMTVEFSARVHVTLGLELKALDLTVGAGLLGIADWVAEQLDGDDTPATVLVQDDSPSLELKKVA